MEVRSVMALIILGATRMLCSFRFVKEVKTESELLASSRLEFSVNILTKNSALPDAVGNTCH